MFKLLKKAKIIFLVMFAVFILSYGSGFLAGKLGWGDYSEYTKTGLFQLNRNLEYKVPLLGKLLRTYKNWHNPKLFKFLSTKNRKGLVLLIFFNNFVVSNFTMALRALLVWPLLFYPFSKFFQGMVFAQAPLTPHTIAMFIGEFGGYFLVICAALSCTIWTVFYRNFMFSSRREAFGNGLKLLGFMYLISGLFILLASIIEASFMLKLIGK
jgi:hypothetical protein